MTHEVSLSEVEMHIFSDGNSIASLLLSDGHANITGEDDSWWELTWVDEGALGLLSELDTFAIRTNSEANFDIRMFDHWAQSWTDQGSG